MLVMPHSPAAVALRVKCHHVLHDNAPVPFLCLMHQLVGQYFDIAPVVAVML